MNQDLIYIGEQIRKERKAQNLSQECLAEDVGIAPRHIGRAENGVSALRLDNFIACAAINSVVRERRRARA